MNRRRFFIILLSILGFIGILMGMEVITDSSDSKVSGDGLSDKILDSEESSGSVESDVLEKEKDSLPRVEEKKEFIPRPSEEELVTGNIFLVFDDAGARIEQIDPFLNLDVPLTIAVLPHLSYSSEVATKVFENGHSVFLHQPMEPIGNQNPGEGAIYFGDPLESISQRITYNLESVPHAIGVNNHMGSRVTADMTIMQRVLEEVQSRDLQFLDSRTTDKSTVKTIADSLAFPVSSRDIFLDHHKSEEIMIESFERGLDHASLHGNVIMIGHVTNLLLADVLAKVIPKAQKAGFRFLPMAAYHKS